MNEKGESMSNNAKVAADLSSFLQLSLPRVAVSFRDVAPDNVPHFDGVVPAGCSFWQQAASRTFVTSAQDHALCSIGVHTHHMADPAPSHQSELADALRAMSGLDYVRAEEVAAIPVITREIKYVVYGPLAQFPLDPHVILLFAHAQQGLIISEAVARVRQGGAAGDGTARLRGDSAGVKWWQLSAESWLLRRARLSRCVVRRHRHVGVSRK